MERDSEGWGGCQQGCGHPDAAYALYLAPCWCPQGPQYSPFYYLSVTKPGDYPFVDWLVRRLQGPPLTPPPGPVSVSPELRL